MRHIEWSIGEPQEESLFDRYGHAIFTYLRWQTSSLEDAEDLTLDVFMAALKRNNLRGLSEREQLAWLRRVARNKVVDSYRRTSNRQLVTLEDIEETVFSSDDQSPEQIALRFEQLSEVSDAIRNLPRLQKQVLRLRYGSDLSIAEIGQLLKKREPAVRQLLSRAISFLRSACHFQEKEGETAR